MNKSLSVFIFYTTSELGNQSSCETFGKKCVRDFVNRLMFLPDNMHGVIEDKEKNPTEIIITGETEKNLIEAISCWFCDSPFYEDGKNKP